MALCKIKNIAANPFRNIDKYPINQDKVDALRESMQSTGYWGNIVARAVNGKFEIAYGHHRLMAIREAYSQDAEIDLIIRDLTDEAMIKIMARENMDEWGSSAKVEHETIRAVVEAFANGLIELEAPPTKTPADALIYAPSFAAGDVGVPAHQHPYTAHTIAKFIGWVQPSGRHQEKVVSALAALGLVKEGLLTEDVFDGLTTFQARAVTTEALRVKKSNETAANIHRKDAEEATRNFEEATDAEYRSMAKLREKAAREKESYFRDQGRQQATIVGEAVSKSLKSGEIGYKEAQEITLKMQQPATEKTLPYFEDFTKKFGAELNRILHPALDKRVGKLQLIIDNRADLPPKYRDDLANILRIVGERFIEGSIQLSSNGENHG